MEITREFLEIRLAGAEAHRDALPHYLAAGYNEHRKIRKAIDTLTKFESAGEWPYKYFIGKCPVKGCKHTQRIKVYTKLNRSGYASDEESLRALYDVKCPEHNKGLRFGELSARIAESVPCDRRCTHARGHNCECSCGGANHGAAWDIE